MSANVGFRRLAVAAPLVRPADVLGNTASIIEAMGACEDTCIELAISPALAVTGASCGDLFFQRDLTEMVESALKKILAASAKFSTIFVVGLPVRVRERLYNSAAIIKEGGLLGVSVANRPSVIYGVPFNRWFAPGDEEVAAEIAIAGQVAPFGDRLVFEASDSSNFRFTVCFDEDLLLDGVDVPGQPLGDATIVCCMSAAHIPIDKQSALKRRLMERSLQHSAAYLFASPGASESSTDLVYSGCLAIADGGGLAILGEGELGDADCSLVRDVDLEVLEIERGRRAPVSQSNNILALESVCVAFDPSGELPDLLSSFFNNVNPLPYAPRNTGENDGYEEAVLRMQSNALATRMRNSGVHRLVLGVSGGLDSTLALLVCVRALKILKLPLENLHCITMPGFGTSARSRANARKLCQYLGVALERIDIKAMCSRQLAALGHDGVTPDATFENVQARMRTSILMNKANTLNALVVGTGDMSELALGWCTYGGDQMSHYAINANIPKTLVRALIEWSRSMVREEPLGKVLKDILKAPISPELLPLGEDGEIKQETEGILGAYELHDFFLYHTLNHGFSKYKIYLLAINAFSGWFSREEILETLTTFIKRFSMQQFKRSAMPDGPAIFSASLSPRTGLRMPSDATVVWPCGVQEGV